MFGGEILHRSIAIAGSIVLGEKIGGFIMLK